MKKILIFMLTLLLSACNKMSEQKGKYMFPNTVLRKIFCCLISSTIIVPISGLLQIHADYVNIEDEIILADNQTTVSEKNIKYFDSDMVEVTVEYTLDQCKPDLYLLANGYEGKSKIIQVSYLTLSNSGTRSESGVDSTYGVSYTLTVNYYYKTSGTYTGYKISSASSTVDYGSDGTSLDYHQFELINSGFNVDNMNAWHTEYPVYTRYSSNAVVYAPSTFIYAVKGGGMPGSGVNYELHLKRGSSRWYASKTLSID